MRKSTIKSLLLGVLMTAGASSAWGQTPTVYYSENYNSATEATGWSTNINGRFTPIILDSYLTVDQSTRNNNGCVVKGEVFGNAVPADTDFTLSFDVKIGSSSQQTPVSLTFYDAANSAAMLSFTATGTWAKSYFINGNESQKVDISNGKQSLGDLEWMTVKMTRKGDVSYLTVTNTSTSAVVFAQNVISTVSSTGGLGKIEFVTRRYNANFAIDNLLVRSVLDSDLPAVSVANYTVKFVDENSNEIKTAETNQGFAGEAVELTAAQTADFKTEDGTTKYIYVSNNGESVKIAKDGSTVVTVKFRKAETYTYSVTSSNGTTIAIGSNFEGESITVPYSRYELIDGTLYEAGVTNKEYRISFVLNDNIASSISYNATSITNVVYFSEGENIAGANATTNGSNMAVRSSNAACGYTTEDITLCTLPAGDYQAVMFCYANSSGGATQDFQLGAEAETTSCAITGGASNGTTFTNNFTFTAEDVVKWLATSNQDSKNGLDYIYIVRVPAKYNYTVATSNGTVLAEGTANEGETISVPYPQYELVDGTLYTKAATNKEYNYSFVVNEETNEVLEYTPAISNVVYFSEAEKIDGMTPSNGGNANIRCSMSYGAYLGGEENVVITNLEAGNYKIVAQMWGNSGATAVISCGEASLECDTKGYIISYTSDVITVSEPTNVEIAPFGGNGKVLDWVYIVKIDDETVTIGSAGYTTYVTKSAVQIPSDIEGYVVDAFKTEGDVKTGVTLSAVEKVPAGTPIILKGKEGPYTLPFIASADAQEIPVNLLKAGPVAGDGATIYALAKKVVVGFYPVAADVTVPAGKAYIVVEKEEAPVKGYFALGDEADAINNIAVEAANGTIYNIAGQKMESIKNGGLYIVNGKKVVVK